MSICQRALFVRQAERCVSLKRRCYVVCTCGACFQRFKVSPLRCFRVSMFHCFAVSEFHRTCGAVSKFQVSPPRCFRVSSLLPYSPKVNPDSVCLLLYRGPQSKPRFYLFAMGRSGGTSCFNDDKVIGLRNLVTERDVIGQCDLIVERDVTERVSACERLRCSLRGRLHIPLQG